MDRVTQGGAIVVRRGAQSPPNDIEVLLVTARRAPGHWIFPKGHVDPGETLRTAALREAEEEAGVTGIVLGPAGSMTFDFGYKTYEVHYFAVAATSGGYPREGRQLVWLPYEQALERLSFENLRTLLTAARPVIGRVGEERGGGR